MKLLLTTAFLAHSLILPSLSKADESGAHFHHAAQQSISDEARPAVAVVDEFSAALRAANLARAGELLADDVLILESGHAERSRREYLGEHAGEDAAFLKSARIEIKKRTARTDGTFAWVGTEAEIHTIHSGTPLILLSSETVVLRQIGGRWTIVHIHWSSSPKK